jgi:hypothetical protein
MGDKPADPKVATDAVPGHPDTVVAEIIKNIGGTVNFKKEDSDKLAASIRSVLTERMGTFDDMRMGRILGHAIATI